VKFWFEQEQITALAGLIVQAGLGATVNVAEQLVAQPFASRMLAV
jgi:hypothetical protein